MSNKELHIQCLNNIRKALLMIEERANVISCMDDFLQTPDGMLRLDAICMNLIALGESVKNFDKITEGKILPLYPNIYWKGVMQIRDKIAHHYFDIDAGIVYTTIKEDIPSLLPTIETMIKDISK
ncbi:HepT-like ribonuclease domain-containing protein [Parabacteroides faecis]|uniref:Uncharacterized protein with HEPN domain n=2 Tax=Parabacteroides faecis TaxID=1217282 RepID=A0ABR6KHG0_9BACT|nr:HepT-like ribonuclease domain-containing protein [Parabacteroides faecis]MBB4620943.1 uncharacterized protein with HEPN domain [Parabacteroides faecis]GGK19313.1 DUF86 domain-containing protein [Parabacteroides faecis]